VCRILQTFQIKQLDQNALAIGTTNFW